MDVVADGFADEILRHAPGIRAHAEYGNGTIRARRDADGAVLHYGYQSGISHQIPNGTVVRQILQGLEIGNSVVKPGAVQTAVEQKFPAVPLQPQPGRQHGVGVVLLHRKHVGPRRGKAQGVKVADDFIGGDAQFFRMAQSPVRGDHPGIPRDRPGQSVKFRRAKDNTFHSLFSFRTSAVGVYSVKRSLSIYFADGKIRYILRIRSM